MSTELHYDDTDKVDVITGTPNETGFASARTEPKDGTGCHAGAAQMEAAARVAGKSDILDQYANQSNPDAHYYGTAQEILNEFGTNLHMVVIGVGTGGTITGVAKRLKEEIPDIIIIGADPVGSILGGGNTVEPYYVEGIGYDFFPEVLDNSLIDSYVKTNDKESFLLSRRLIREEGLLCGGSCGSAMAAALQAATKLDKNQKCLVILPDGIRNYMTKFANDDWMESKGFKTE
mgnify:CR=1 FL=1